MPGSMLSIRHPARVTLHDCRYYLRFLRGVRRVVTYYGSNEEGAAVTPNKSPYMFNIAW